MGMSKAKNLRHKLHGFVYKHFMTDSLWVVTDAKNKKKTGEHGVQVWHRPALLLLLFFHSVLVGNSNREWYVYLEQQRCTRFKRVSLLVTYPQVTTEALL